MLSHMGGMYSKIMLIVDLISSLPLGLLHCTVHRSVVRNCKSLWATYQYTEPLPAERRDEGAFLQRPY